MKNSSSQQPNKKAGCNPTKTDNRCPTKDER
nr:MAG TPA: hypothetical protein [Caudoviricetes sp.]